MINFSRIQDNLFVGTCPTGVLDIKRLCQAGISAVVNLQSDRDFVALGIDWQAMEHLYYEMELAVYRVPMIDFDESDIARLLPEAVRSLDTALSAGHRVYLHCTAGRERSPTTAVAWLSWCSGLSLDQALSLVREARVSNPYEMILRDLAASAQPA
ncbi:MAG: dual specificity protein phosphatase family protein [Gammaproteobacteria bacterium]